MTETQRVALAGAVVVALGILVAGGRPDRADGAAQIEARAPAQQDPRADLFVRRGCADCHAISSLGVKAKSDVGPDLTSAYADVGVRYGVTLESFLRKPTGIMRVMLTEHLTISRADRDSIEHLLRALYLEQRADVEERLPPPLRSGRTP